MRRTGAAKSCLKGHHLGLQSARVLGSTEMWHANTKREMLCTTAREHARMLSQATPAFRAPSFRMPSLAKRQLADLVLRSLLWLWAPPLAQRQLARPAACPHPTRQYKTTKGSAPNPQVHSRPRQCLAPGKIAALGSLGAGSGI